jgi:hypothetical protein
MIGCTDTGLTGCTSADTGLTGWTSADTGMTHSHWDFLRL